MIITGTNGNDVLQNPGGSGSLVLVLAGTSADGGVWPSINILVNGVAVQSNISVTANNATGATQTVTVPVPTNATSVAIQYTNDSQTDWNSGDRNLYIKSVSLNGVALDPTTASYDRTQNGAYFDTVAGQADMVWGGTLTFSGATVTSAAASTSVATSDSIDGLAGLDTLVYAGARGEYTISHPSNWTVTHGAEVDTVVNVERLQFSNMKHALDMNGNAGGVAKLIGALFGESYLSVKEYVGVGLNLADQGRSGTQLADLAVNTSQFQQRAGSFSNADFVHTVAQNLGYTGDVSGFIADLDAGRTTKAALAVMAADTSYNAAHLVGVMQAGIDYV